MLYFVLEQYISSPTSPKNKISSFGKPNIGKTSFLNFMFRNQQPQVNHNQIQHKNFLITPYNQFDLIDISEIINPQEGIKNEVHLFTVALLLSNKVLLHILENDMKNPDFIQMFAYKFYHSSRTCLKFTNKLPEIIIIIRDPSIYFKTALTVAEYDDLVIDFAYKVNMKISKFAQSLYEIYENTNEKKKSNESERDILIDDFKSCVFKVSHHCCAFAIKNDSLDSVEYLELRRGDYEWDFYDNGFEKFSNRAICVLVKEKRSNDVFNKNRASINGASIDFTTEIKKIVLTDKKNAKGKFLAQKILCDINFNVFLAYTLPQSHAKLLDYCKKYKIKLEKLNKKFSKIIEKSTENNKTYSDIWKTYETEINKQYAKNTEDMPMIESMVSYFKYNTAISFTYIFSLRSTIKDSLCYSILNSIMKYSSNTELINYEFNKLEKCLGLFKCYINFDDNFKEILKNLMPQKFVLTECIAEIYSQIIEFTINKDYKYEDVLIQQKMLYEQKDYIQHIRRLVKIFFEYIIDGENTDEKFENYMKRIEYFIEKLKTLHSMLLIENNKALIVTDENLKIKRICESVTIKFPKMLYKIAPPATGLFFGLMSTVAPVQAIPGLNLAILGIGALATYFLTSYAYNQKTKRKILTLNLKADEGYYIEDYIIIKDHSYGTISNENEHKSEDKTTFDYTACLTSDGKSSGSACLNVVCILVCKRIL
ncbi:hypothetical protein SteCoe_20643 [Stentor coeruleus]|uniref:Uncharacterized protein n=1 Tax=Stentor coeruleus TaxID=5963 RepID=A0A1R2BRH8_9CILI|nr:hypothetical protein SteCoe_20643 [Stentor coeruleus]